MFVRHVGPPRTRREGPGLFIPAALGEPRVRAFSVSPNTQVLGVRFLFPERIRGILVCFVFILVTLLQRIFSKIFYH